VECFFLGGLAFIAYEKLVKGGDVRNASIALPLFVLSAWAGTLAAGISGRSVISEGLPLFFRIIFSNWTNFILFPVTIMALALIETKIGTLGKRFSFIGEISYSSYLLHFPLQLAIAIAVSKLAITQTLFYSPWFLISFYVVLVTISLASHRYFELPVQRMLRVHEK
jgi:peptidoglycan/LPS O-acetylase OafA/YrhL